MKENALLYGYRNARSSEDVPNRVHVWTDEERSALDDELAAELAAARGYRKCAQAGCITQLSGTRLFCEWHNKQRYIHGLPKL